MKSLTSSISHDASNADVGTVKKEINGEVTHQKRKYVKRKAEDKIKFQPVSSDWQNNLADNKLVVSMNSGIFQQDVVIHQANAAFMQNFGFKDAAYVAGVAYNAACDNCIEQRGAVGLPFRALIGDTPLKMSSEKWGLELTPPLECPTSNRVLTNVMHSMASGVNTSFFCILLDSCHRPMFCHLHCVPIANPTLPLKATKLEIDSGNQAAFLSTHENVQSIFWAVLNIRCASQIGCAMQFGIGYGLKTHEEYSEEAKQAFKRAHEKG